MPEITQEELDNFNKYKELGEVDTIASELSAKQTLERQNLVSQVAELTGFKTSVLSKLATDVEFEVREGKAYVGDKTVEEYAEETWADFLPSLKEEVKSNGVNFVRQATKPSENKQKISANVTSYLKSIYGTQKTV